MTEQASITLEGASFDVCKNCGEDIYGHYCPKCGQKHRTENEYSIKHFLRHALHEVTEFDSKIFRSLLFVLFRPGTLTAEWCSGREASFMKPMRLFLMVNLFYFLFMHFFPISTIVVPLEFQYTDQTYSNAVRPMIDRRVKDSHSTFKQFAQRYDDVSETEAKSLVILMVPMFALFIAALYYRSHRYVVEHLVFSLHFFSFFLILISAFSIALKFAVNGSMQLFGLSAHYVPNWDEIITLCDGVAIAIYLVFALQKVYAGKLWTNIVRASALTYTLLYILFLYRFILLFSTLYTMPVKL